MRQFATAVLLFSAVAACAQLTPPAVSQVPGVPLSAEFISESHQVLQDGNRITRVMKGRIFRDSAGRTRREIAAAVTEPPSGFHVQIRDPIQHALISFCTSSSTPSPCVDRVAHVRQMHFSTPAVSTTQAGPPATGDAVSTRNALPAQSNTPKVVEPRTGVSSRPTDREDLGSNTIEGFTVHGTKSTRTIPAGAVGNDQPIVIVREVWDSPELSMTLQSETEDPQWGHSSLKVTNIKRSEPDPALFQVPPDYTVKED